MTIGEREGDRDFILHTGHTDTGQALCTKAEAPHAVIRCGRLRVAHCKASTLPRCYGPAVDAGTSAGCQGVRVHMRL